MLAPSPTVMLSPSRPVTRKRATGTTVGGGEGERESTADVTIQTRGRKTDDVMAGIMEEDGGGGRGRGDVHVVM